MARPFIRASGQAYRRCGKWTPQARLKAEERSRTQWGWTSFRTRVLSRGDDVWWREPGGTYRLGEYRGRAGKLLRVFDLSGAPGSAFRKLAPRDVLRCGVHYTPEQMRRWMRAAWRRCKLLDRRG